MPEYPCQCPKCGPVIVYDRASNSENLRCPDCSAKVEQDYARKFAGGVLVAQDTVPEGGPRARESGGLHGRLFDHQCSPKEAKQRAQALSEFGLGHVYKPNGTASVNSKSEMKKLVKAQGELMRRAADGKKVGWNGKLAQ